MRARPILALVFLPQLAAADGLTVFTVDKVAAFRNGRGTVRVGHGPHLTSAPSPACPPASGVWYDLALAVGRGGGRVYPLLATLESRATSVAERIARFRDADPSNDPTLMGAGPEACARLSQPLTAVSDHRRVASSGDTSR
jgi:hypothetical protein